MKKEKMVEREVNTEFDTAKPVYSRFDVNSAVDYAFSAVKVDVSEVGKEVYGNLIHEKILEFLENKI